MNSNLPTPTFEAPFVFPTDSDPAESGFSGTFTERSTGSAFTLKIVPGDLKTHKLISIDHGEGRPLIHMLTQAEFNRLFEKY